MSSLICKSLKNVTENPDMQRFLSQASNIDNTFNVLLTPRVSSIVVHFG
jgi:hypothetical protein